MIPVSPPFFQETERAPSLRLRESVGWSFYWLLRPRSLGGIDTEFAGRILPDSTLEPSCRSLGIWWRFRIMLLTFYGMEMEMFASSFSTLGWLCLGHLPVPPPRWGWVKVGKTIGNQYISVDNPMSIWGSLWSQFAYWRSPHHHF